jgi:uncharacterized protein
MADPNLNGFWGWLYRNSPKREDVIKSRWLRPFAHRIGNRELWRFTRRSVPRGVALGLLVGIFLLIPGIQIIGVAMLALPFRANIPIGAAMTFLSNPATTPFILLASTVAGNWALGLHADAATFDRLIREGAGLADWTSWLFSEAAPAMLAGLSLIAIVSAIIGYALTVIIWRFRVAGKWRRRHRRSH